MPDLLRSDPRLDPARFDACLRPVLRPGVLVTRRDGRHLQVGLDPAVLVPATEINRQVLADLVAGRRVAPEARSTSAWRLLADHDLLVDGDELGRRLPADEDAARAVAAVYAVAGRVAGGRLHARAGRSVVVDAPDTWRGLALDLLGRCGVPAAASGGQPDVHLLMSLGPVDRDRLDAAMRDDVAHVVVASTLGGVEVGPFVVPGLTACLRCTDAARAERDPHRSLVLDQQAKQGPWRADGVPTPLDPVLATAALAWAVRDVVAYLDDETPTTWSATVTLGPGMEQSWDRWRRHPRCGCSWLTLERAE